MTALTLLSPMAGWASCPSPRPRTRCSPKKWLGDGVAIDPTVGELRAPCDGEVIGLHEAGHAVTLRSNDGPEILLHIGLETVSLGGRGFVAHVAKGDAVKAGRARWSASIST